MCHCLIVKVCSLKKSFMFLRSVLCFKDCFSLLRTGSVYCSFNRSKSEIRCDINILVITFKAVPVSVPKTEWIRSLWHLLWALGRPAWGAQTQNSDLFCLWIILIFMWQLLFISCAVKESVTLRFTDSCLHCYYGKELWLCKMQIIFLLLLTVQVSVSSPCLIFCLRSADFFWMSPPRTAQLLVVSRYWYTWMRGRTPPSSASADPAGRLTSCWRPSELCSTDRKSPRTSPGTQQRAQRITCVYICN